MSDIVRANYVPVCGGRRRRTVVLIFLAAVALIASAIASASQEPSENPYGANTDQKEFKAAGVCARCHVVSVVEWGISGHRDVGTTCQSCHGCSEGHVANERNEIKPQRLPRGANIAGQLCLTCHKSGCPKTQKAQTCQECHHVHALIEPMRPVAVRNGRANDMLQRWNGYNTHMAAGRRHVEQRDWPAAQKAFASALRLVPGDRRAGSQWHMCRRRIDPALPGFRIVDNDFDLATGLPRDVKVQGFDIEMRLVPPSVFDMGSDAHSDSKPVHTVNVNAFYLGRCEVTQAQWQAVMGENPAGHQGERFSESGQMPVERVSWDDCVRFIHQLNDRVVGGGFRLPSEAQWEYACRAGDDTMFRPDDISEFAWYRGNSLRDAGTEGELLELDAFSPRPVGRRRANRWGFFDMSGNVGEWCSSLWRPYVYDRRDGREALDASGLRVVRGGSYADRAEGLDPAMRHAMRAARRLRFNGLRLARNVPALGARDTMEISK